MDIPLNCGAQDFQQKSGPDWQNSTHVNRHLSWKLDMCLRLDQAPGDDPANFSRVAACRIYFSQAVSAGFVLRGKMHGFGEKGRSLPEVWCPVMIKFITEY